MVRATSKGNEVKSKMRTRFRYAHTKIRTQVVVICDLTRYQLDPVCIYKQTDPEIWQMMMMMMIIITIVWIKTFNYSNWLIINFVIMTTDQNIRRHQLKRPSSHQFTVWPGLPVPISLMEGFPSDYDQEVTVNFLDIEFPGDAYSDHVLASIAGKMCLYQCSEIITPDQTRHNPHGLCLPGVRRWRT